MQAAKIGFRALGAKFLYQQSKQGSWKPALPSSFRSFLYPSHPGFSRPFTNDVYSPATFLSKDDVTLRVLNLLKSSEKVDPSKVYASSHLQRDLELDDLDTVEIVMALENEFAVEIPDSEIEKMASCADIIGFIASHPQAK